MIRKAMPVLALLLFPSASAAAVPGGKLRALAERACIWGYPMVRAAQVRQNLTRPEQPMAGRPPSIPGAPINRFGHAGQLGSPRMRQGVAPNNDTLYSVAWLDMADGPFVLETPDFGARYYTFQMGQADTSTQQSLGRRTHGARLPPVFLRGSASNAAVPRGMVEVRSAQRYLMIAARILVHDEVDLPAVTALQQKIRLRRWVDVQAGRDVPPPVSDQLRVSTAPFAGKPAEFLTSLGQVLRDWQPSKAEASLVRSFEAIGLSRADGFRREQLSAAEQSAVFGGVGECEQAIRRKTFKLGRNVNGWSINAAGSEFGTDYLLRAAVAMDQIYVLPREEALYPNARLDASGQSLDGRNRYELHFAKGQVPPVRFFWSATMYHAEGLMVDNPIGRYSIGDRTPGLVRDADGGIRILIQHDQPTPGERANWLPAPAGPFMLMLRLYGPSGAAQRGAWTPPGIVKLPPARP